MKKITFYFLSTFLLCHCASVSTLQTGRVLEKGDSVHAVGVALYNSDDFLGGDDISSPVLEYAYRRGMWDKIDVGIKLAVIGTAVADIKYNLIDGEKLALATGLGLGYLSFESEAGTVKQSSTIIDLIIPLYLSYDVGEMTSLYTSAKYFYRSVSADGGVDIAGDGSMLSASLGIKYGEKMGVFLEGSLITGLDNDFAGTQFASSYFFRF